MNPLNLQCKKCGLVVLTLDESGPHVKASCGKCGAYIKFLSKADVEIITNTKGKEKMAGVNKVILVGRVGKDPDLKFLQSGAAVCNFSVATSEEWKDKLSGEKKEKTEWHRVVVWARLAEICGQYLEKGKQVYVEGRLETREWEKDGVKRYQTEIIADTVQFLGDRERQKDQPERRPEKPAPPARQPSKNPTDGYEYPVATDGDDSIPF